MGYANPQAGQAREARRIPGAPTAGTSEVQTLTPTNTPTGGTFRLSFKNQITAAIAYDADGAAVQAALRLLPSIAPDGVTVSGSAGGPWVVTFANHLAKLDVPLLKLVNNLMTGSGSAPSMTIVATTPGVTATERGAPAGTEIVRSDNGVKYVNTGTASAPIWTQQTVPSAEMAALEAAIPTAAVADVAAADAAAVSAANGTAVATADAVVTAVADADATYGQPEADLINDLKAKYNAAVALANANKAQINVLVTLANSLKTQLNANTTETTELKAKLNLALARLRTAGIIAP